MKSKIQSFLCNKQFFKVIKSTNNSVEFTLQKPSQLLIRNIYISWLRYLNTKTQKVMPIFIQKSQEDLQKTIDVMPPLGIIKHKEVDYKDRLLTSDGHESQKKSDLQLKLIVPQQDLMQYFIQWQRYRKYWWSSITTSPSLFAIGDINQGETEANVDIIVKLPCGTQPVEHIQIINHDNQFEGSSCLTCDMSLEHALFILMLDGSNNSNDEYLRLHRNVSPYKISFALNFEDSQKKESLKELAKLLFHRIELEKISARLPDFALPLEDQIKGNLHMGVPFTAILNESTLDNGIFHLMNSSTMLKEQLHVADFHTYAAILCNVK